MTRSDDTQRSPHVYNNSNSSHLLELSDGLWRPQDPLRSVGGHLGSLTVGSPPEQLIELCDEELVRAPEIVADGHAERQVAVVECVLQNIIDRRGNINCGN